MHQNQRQKPFPTQDQLLDFVYQTHTLERIDLKMAEVNATYKGQSRTPNAYADGHFKAISYAWNQLIDTDRFPGRKENLQYVPKSDAALYWLRELHKQMLLPLTNHPVMLAHEDPNVVLSHQIGKYRSNPQALTLTMAPHPQLIKPILHNWINNLALLHERLGQKSTQIYALTQPEAKELIQAAHNTKMLVATTLPFHSSINRLARLLENLLRLQWRLPWKNLNKHDYEKFTTDLTDFQIHQLPTLITKAQSTK